MISLEEAKRHLNVDADFNDDDSYIEECVAMAVDIVCEECDRDLSDLLDFEGNLKKVAKSAMLLKLGDLYAYRESSYTGTINAVPHGYQRLISLLRRY